MQKLIEIPKMTITELKKYEGKIITVYNPYYIWMFKLVKVNKDNVVTSCGMDIYPQPNEYLMKIHNIKFYDTYEYVPFKEYDYRLPTKLELNLYRKYTRELRLLGTNKSNYGNN